MMRCRTPGLFVAAMLFLGCGDGDEPGGGSGGDGGAAGGGGSSGAAGAGGEPAYTSEVYSKDEHWLCLPGGAVDHCGADLDATKLFADGTLEIEPHEPASAPPIDCFYVYPTISNDQTPNSDLVPGPEEISVAQVQAARLTRECRVFAPVYRQNTLASLFGTVQSEVTLAERREIAYADALDAWRHYLANHGAGRGYVLIGHSQGAGILRRLIEEEIDDVDELRERLVAAYLIGSTLTVPEGADVGGDFANVPLCRDDSQIGCAVSYATFRSTDPPPSGSFFGRSASGQAACNSPASLAGGKATLIPYFPQVSAQDPGVTTPYVTYPSFLEGECVESGGFSYLELTILADPADPRRDDIGGDLTPEWGLHLVDVHVQMGDIVELVSSQSAAYGG